MASQIHSQHTQLYNRIRNCLLNMAELSPLGGTRDSLLHENTIDVNLFVLPVW